MQRMLGKLAPKLDLEGQRLTSQAFGTILPAVDPTPRWGMPADRKWPMFLNDQLGCCTASEKANITLHLSRIAQAPIIWPDPAVLALYQKTSNYTVGKPWTDQGAVLATVNNHMASDGIWIDTQNDEIWTGTINMDQTNLDHLCLAIDIFGAVSAGWNLTEAMYNSDNARWDYVPGSPDMGGHCAPLVYYRTVDGKREFLTATWSEEFWISEDCIKNQMDEAWLVINRQHWERMDHTTPYGDTFDAVLNYATSLA